MRITVTDQVVVIPRDWFLDVEEVDVEKTKDAVVVRPILARDPILDLGKNPVECVKALPGRNTYRTATAGM